MKGGGGGEISVSNTSLVFACSKVYELLVAVGGPPCSRTAYGGNACLL